MSVGGVDDEDDVLFAHVLPDEVDFLSLGPEYRSVSCAPCLVYTLLE